MGAGTAGAPGFADGYEEVDAVAVVVAGAAFGAEADVCV